MQSLNVLMGTGMTLDTLKATHNLTEAVNFLSEQFHVFGADKKLKEKIINSLRGQVSVLHDDLKKIQAQVEEQAQYTCRNCLKRRNIKEETRTSYDKILCYEKILQPNSLFIMINFCDK